MKNGSFVSLQTVRVLIKQGVLTKIKRRQGMSTGDLLILYSEQAKDRYGAKLKEFDLEEINVEDFEEEKPLGGM
jgi:hypothetical protein